MADSQTVDSQTVSDDSASNDHPPVTTADAGIPTLPIMTPVVPACPTGKHMCPGGCVANDDIHTCGTSCTPCQAPADGTATCDGMSCGGACLPGKKLCLGVCIDMTAACSGECPIGQHLCAGLCPSVMDVKACGTSCLPCPVPIGATQASCDATTCDFQCMTGTHKCGSRCPVDNDVTACGAACTPCPTDPNGVAQCVGGACGIACKAGYHTCGGRCVSNADTGSCGATSCAACQGPMGGTVTCDGAMCVPACPTGMKLCAGMCIDMAAACSGVCPAGTHNCSGICASNTSVDTCGTTSCAACPKPTGTAATTCNGTACDFTCGAGYHRCGARCAPDNDPTGCGAACVICPTDVNGAAACVAGACGLMCKSGFHVCGGKCVDNKAVATCGPNDSTSCTACQAPTGGGSVTCDGLACVPACPTASKLCAGACISNANACNGMCPAGMHNCSGICQSDISPSFCGPTCVSCQTPASNGAAVCNGATATTGTCGITCSATFKNCPNTSLCVPMAGCCANGDCTTGPANTTGMCGTANTCSYPCAAGFKMCLNACIPMAACCTSTDCPAACQSCPGPGGTCASVKGQDDVDSCAGTCDAAGSCKSKQGQSCQATPGGCIAPTQCGANGVCILGTGGAGTGGAGTGGAGTGGAGTGGASGALPIEFVTVRSTADTIAFRQVTVPCPVGKKALGAGWEIADPTLALFSGQAEYFLPSFDGQSWLVNGVARVLGSSWLLSVTVACGTVPGYVLATGSTAVDATARKTVSVTCPAGTQAMGAGWAVLDPTSVILDGEAVQFQMNAAGTTWQVTATNLSTFAPTWKLSETVLCAPPAEVPGYQIITQVAAVATAATQQLNVPCPAPKRPLMGGYAFLDTGGLPIDGTAVYSIYNGANWLAGGTTLPVNSTMQVRVVCVN